MAKPQGIIAALTQEERIAILEASIDKEAVGTHILRRFEETIRERERELAAYAAVVYALAHGSGTGSLVAVYASYRHRADDAAEKGDEGRFMYEYYIGIAKALLGVLDALE